MNLNILGLLYKRWSTCLLNYPFGVTSTENNRDVFNKKTDLGTNKTQATSHFISKLRAETPTWHWAGITPESWCQMKNQCNMKNHTESAAPPKCNATSDLTPHQKSIQKWNIHRHVFCTGIFTIIMVAETAPTGGYMYTKLKYKQIKPKTLLSSLNLKIYKIKLRQAFSLLIGAYEIYSLNM